MKKAKDGNSKILVMIDHDMKFVIVKATKDGSTETAVKILFEELICKYGASKELWSDRRKSFIGEVAKGFYGLVLNQTKVHIRISPSNERINGEI